MYKRQINDNSRLLKLAIRYVPITGNRYFAGYPENVSNFSAGNIAHLPPLSMTSLSNTALQEKERNLATKAFPTLSGNLTPNKPNHARINSAFPSFFSAHAACRIRRDSELPCLFFQAINRNRKRTSSPVFSYRSQPASLIPHTQQKRGYSSFPAHRIKISSDKPEALVNRERQAHWESMQIT